MGSWHEFLGDGSGSTPFYAQVNGTSNGVSDRTHKLQQQREAFKTLFGKEFEAGDQWAVPQILTQDALYTGGWHTYWHEIYDEAMRHSRTNALAMANDEWLMACLWERIRAVTGLKWSIEVENKSDPWQALVKSGITRAIQRSFRPRRLFRQLSWALWPGRYGTQCLWEWDAAKLETPKGTQECKLLRLAAHLPINGDKIGYKLDHTPYVLVYGGEERALGDVTPIWTTKARAIPLTGSWRERVLIHQVNVQDADYEQSDRADMIHGVGIRNYLYWSWWLKNEYVTSVIKSLDRFGLGFVVIEYDQSNPVAKEEALLAAKNLSVERSIMVIPTSPKLGATGAVRVVETPVAGMGVLLQLQEACQAREERFIIGQTGSSRSESSGMGNHDLSMMADTKFQLIEEDANDLAETLTGSPREPGLVSIIKKWSFPWADFPAWFKFSLNDPDPERKLGSATMFWNLGGGVTEKEAREFAGLSEPGPEDKVLHNPQIEMAEQQVEQAKQQMQAQEQQGQEQQQGGAAQQGDATFDGLMVPQRGPKGGSWMVDPATGKKRHVDPSELWQKYERGEAELYGLLPGQKPPAPANQPIAPTSGKGVAAPVGLPKAEAPAISTPRKVSTPAAHPSSHLKTFIEEPGIRQWPPHAPPRQPEPIEPPPPKLVPGQPHAQLVDRQQALAKIFTGVEPKAGPRSTSYAAPLDAQHRMQVSLDHDAADAELKFWRADKEFPVDPPLAPPAGADLSTRLDYHRLARDIHGKVKQLGDAGVPVRFSATPKKAAVLGKLLAGLGFRRAYAGKDLLGKSLEKWVPTPQTPPAQPYARDPNEPEEDPILTPEDLDILFGPDEPDAPEQSQQPPQP